QAEDGIRDFHVTGVQTCALPISLEVLMPDSETELKQALAEALSKAEERGDLVIATSIVSDITAPMAEAVKAAYAGIFTTQELARSEERRVGKECRCRRSS